MQYAVDRRTKRVIHADQVRQTDRHHAYECPVCKAEVHYRRAMGLSPEPGFAHNAHVAGQDCHLYHHSPGSESMGSRGATSALERINEIDLCLEDRLDDEGTWSLFLRFLEISDLGTVSLRTLTDGAVNIVSRGYSTDIPLMELRPGVGSGRVSVPPSLTPYDATPTGKWPSNLPSDRWNGSCAGLNLRGTLFVFRDGEWERVRPGAEVKLGSEIRIVAGSTNAPPAEYSSESTVTVSHNKVTWRMWRMMLPDVVSDSLDQWAEAIGLSFAPPADQLSLIAVPQGSGAGGPIFAIGHHLVVKVKWAPNEAPGILSLRTPFGSESNLTWPTEESPAYLTFSVRDAGITSLMANYDRRSSVVIEAAAEPTASEVRKKLGAVQPLQIRIGETLVKAWQESVSLTPTPRQASPPPVTISPDFDALRLDMRWTNKDGVQYNGGLTAQMVKSRLLTCWGQNAEFHINAGAFGSVHLLFLRPKCTQSNPSISRATRWAVLANGRPGHGDSSWIRRNLAATKVGSLRGRGTSARWIPLLVNEMKRSKK